MYNSGKFNTVSKSRNQHLLFRAFKGVFGYGGYFVSSLFFIIFALPLNFILSIFPKTQKRVIRLILHGYSTLLTQYYLPALGVYSIEECSGFSSNMNDSGLIFIANHRSRIDVLFLLSKINNSAAVIKSNYAKMPVFSSLVKYFDFINIDQNSLNSLDLALNKAKSLLDEGKNIIIFPEGTRSKSGKLLPFKDFAFKLSIDSNKPIVPVLIHSEIPFMAKKRHGSLVPPFKFRFIIRSLGQFFPEEKESPADFNTRIYTKMRKHIIELDKNTIWESGKI